jgi:hypothetical protein
VSSKEGGGSSPLSRTTSRGIPLLSEAPPRHEQCRTSGAFVVHADVPSRPDRTGADRLAALAAGVPLADAAGRSRSDGEIAVRHCYASPVLEVLDDIGEYHPCDVMPIFLPSVTDAGDAARNDAAAIATDETQMLLRYVPSAERDVVVTAWLRDNGFRPPVQRNPRGW